MLLAVVGLVISDALVKLQLTPWMRVAALAALCGALLVAFLRSGTARQPVDHEGICDSRRPVLGRGGRPSVSRLRIGRDRHRARRLPLGILCFWVPKLRAVVLQVLSLIQTIPSLALFGLLMLPLGYIATHVPLAPPTSAFAASAPRRR